MMHGQKNIKKYISVYDFPLVTICSVFSLLHA